MVTVPEHPRVQLLCILLAKDTGALDCSFISGDLWRYDMINWALCQPLVGLDSASSEHGRDSYLERSYFFLVESRSVLGLAAGNEVAVDDDLEVNPIPSRI